MRQVTTALIAGAVLVVTLVLGPPATAEAGTCSTTTKKGWGGVGVEVQCEEKKQASQPAASSGPAAAPAASSGPGQEEEIRRLQEKYERCLELREEAGTSLVTGELIRCDPPPSVFTSLPETAPDAAAREATEAVVRQAAAELQLPSPDPKVGPDPSLNKWNIVAVGYPIWLWVEGPRDVATTVTQNGITITINARLRRIRFDMGDGTKKWCAEWNKWYQHGLPPRESPSCGYRYQQLPEKKGAGYDLTAEAHWDVTWSANGHTGTVKVTRTATRHLNIAEIQSVITSRE